MRRKYHSFPKHLFQTHLIEWHAAIVALQPQWKHTLAQRFSRLFILLSPGPYRTQIWHSHFSSSRANSRALIVSSFTLSLTLVQADRYLIHATSHGLMITFCRVCPEYFQIIAVIHIRHCSKCWPDFTKHFVLNGVLFLHSQIAVFIGPVNLIHCVFQVASKLLFDCSIIQI